jgi:hypothetical protein
MLRAIVLAITIALACASTASAFSAAYLTLDPKDPGAGTEATLHVRLQRGFPTPREVALRVARGTELDPRAVGARCSVAEAADDDCPAASRIGGGTAAITNDKLPVDIDLYLAPRPRPGDVAGVVMVTRRDDRIGVAPGRVFRLDEDVYRRKGIQFTFRGVRDALKPPAGSERVLRRLNVHLGAHRTVAGERVDLITNPSKCGPDGWPWTLSLGAPGGTNFYHGPIDCSRQASGR